MTIVGWIYCGIFTQWNTIRKWERTNDSDNGVELINEMLSERSQTQRQHMICFHSFEVQKQAKLIYCAYLGAVMPERGHTKAILGS